MHKICDSNKLIDAARDYKYLLTRGYPANASLNLVTSRYLLNEKERLLLYRCIHSAQYVDEINNKFLCYEIRDHILLIDFYNVLISTVNMVKGGDVYLCDDCIPRDLRGSKLRKDDYSYLQASFKIISKVIELLKPKLVVAIVDKNVSYSIEHADMLKLELRNHGIDCTYELTLTPDSRIIQYSKNFEHNVVASSDSFIMLHSVRILPLTTYIMLFLGIKPQLDFASVFNSSCNNCLDEIVKAMDKNYKRNP